MKKTAVKHPYLTGFLVSLLIVIVSPILGAVIEQKYYPTEQDSVHGGGILITVFLGFGLIFGILAGLTTAYILKRRQEKIANRF